MDDDEFWQIIDRTKESSDGSVEEQSDLLRDVLGELPVEEVVAFNRRMVAANRRLDGWAYRGAATVMLGACGDDSFTDFRSWVISQGRQTYLRFVDDPDSIVDAGLRDEEEIGAAEVFAYVPSEVFAEQSDQELYEAFPDDVDEPTSEPTGEPLDDSDDAQLRATYPRLAAVYMSDGSRFTAAQGHRFRLPRPLRRND